MGCWAGGRLRGGRRRNTNTRKRKQKTPTNTNQHNPKHTTPKRTTNHPQNNDEQINVVSGFSTFSATILAATWIFGETVKGVFQSVVFLFLTHPLDVGDMIALPPDDAWFRVKRFGLVNTQLVRENGDLMHVPNSKLWTGALVNLTRSARRVEVVRVLLEVARSVEYLHERRLLHCDLKLDNVLLKSDVAHDMGFACKLADFGLTKLMNDQ